MIDRIDCADYRTYRLDELGIIVGGSTPSTSHQEYYGGDINWITPKDLSNNQSKYISHGERNITKDGYDSCSTEMLPINSIVMSSRAPIGYLAITREELCTNQGCKSIIPNTDFVDVEYLYYALLRKKDTIKELGSGTTFPEISRKVFGSIEVELPPLDKQREISSILTSIDGYITNNNQINDYLCG